MDKLLSVHEKKGTKQAKTKKTKPVKVVYISNPMKVKTTASEFRALVQELTGRDSGTPDHTKYLELDGPDEIIKETISYEDDHGVLVPRMEPAACEVPTKRSDLTFEPYDDVFMPQMLENFTGFFPSTFLCESPHVEVHRSL